MTERRLHVATLPEGGGLVTLDEAASQHVRVWRLRPGDPVELFDGRGRASDAEVQTLDPQVTCFAQPPREPARGKTRVTLVLGLPKGSKLDDCVRMATELGAHEIALLQAERSVPRWTDARARARVERLARVAAEASAQCERSDVPAVHAPQHLDAWLARFPLGASGVVFGARADTGLSFTNPPEKVWCAVGPEGGFSDAELRAFEAAGFSVVSLGPTVLRVDTAVAAGLSVVADRLRVLQAD